MKHTKAKWITVRNSSWGEDNKKIFGDKPGYLICFKNSNREIVTLASVIGASREEAEANAKLISAAPDLLEAAIAIIANADDRIMHLDYEGITEEHYVMLKAAIDKATQEQV